MLRMFAFDEFIAFGLSARPRSRETRSGRLGTETRAFPDARSAKTCRNSSFAFEEVRLIALSGWSISKHFERFRLPCHATEPKLEARRDGIYEFLRRFTSLFW